MKIIITEKQYKMILLNETKNKSILNEVKDDIVIDNNIILAINYLLGKKVTNHNEELLKNALNENTFKEIKNIFESKEKLKQLEKTMENKGFQNPLEILKNNFDSIMKKFNKESKKYTLGFLAEI